VPIPGTRNSNHLRENLAAIQLQVTPAEIAGMDAAFAELTVRGGRMNKAQMEIVQP
jgi:aryl-alcohol dehydrogenase-like predicted oxidoreductase